MTTAIYPGSFDPVTYGHLDVIGRAADVFDRVVVGLLANPRKTPLWPTEERMACLREAIDAGPAAVASRVEIIDGPRRVKDRHLKMAFRQDGRVMRGIAWRASEREAFVTEHRGAIDLAFSLEQDVWDGERYLQLSVADFKAPDA